MKHFFSKRIGNHFLGLIFLLLSVNNSIAQNIISSQKTGEEIFTARTKQFSEFTDRFNYRSDFNGYPVDQAFMAKMPRTKMISLLFDLNDPRAETGNQNYSEQYIKTRTEFITEVNEKQLLINSHSSGIIAEARTRVSYNGKPYTISLFLNQEMVGKTSIKWVLLSAKGEILNIFKEDTSIVRFIPPSSHETDFINLKRALEDTDHLQDYAFNDFKPDLLTIFFYCIRSGIVKYEYVEDVTYHIIDIPGWYFKVKDFNRNELNSGWLISDISKNNLTLPDFVKSL
jgi:hypothetical protein